MRPLAAALLASSAALVGAGCARLLPEPPAYAAPAREAAQPRVVTVTLADSGGAATLRIGDTLRVALPAWLPVEGEAARWAEVPVQVVVPLEEPVLSRVETGAVPSGPATPGPEVLAFVAERTGSQMLALGAATAMPPGPDTPMAGTNELSFTLTVVVR